MLVTGRGCGDVSVDGRTLTCNVTVAHDGAHHLPYRLTVGQGFAKDRAGNPSAAQVIDCQVLQADGEGARCAPFAETAFAVTWAGVPDEWPAAVLSRKYEVPAPPASEVSVIGADPSSAMLYLATGLPCGISIDSTTGAVSGVARDATASAIVAILAQSGERTALVNRRSYTLTARECDDATTCNGGTCVHGEDAFDGEFSCDCVSSNATGSFCDVPVAASAAAARGLSDSTIGLVAGVAGGVALALVVLAAFVVRRHGQRRRPYDFQAAVAALKAEGVIKAESASSVPREMARRSVRLLEKLGAGQFGDVHRAMVSTEGSGAPSFLAAVKTLKEGSTGADKRELMEEATLMAQMQHANLVGIVGVCTRAYPVLLVLEYCEHGALLGFLRKRTGFDALGLPQQLKVALDTARGIAYLAAAGMVHRDLAARSVLVDSAYTCKVADFGLSRRMDNDYYRASASGAIPLRWTAIEVLTARMTERRYTPATDVWSFGVLLHEIFTDGCKPYADMANAVVLARVAEGYRLPRPDACPASLYSLMSSCWAANPTERPRFAAIVRVLKAAHADAGGPSQTNGTRRQSGGPRQSAAAVDPLRLTHDGYLKPAATGELYHLAADVAPEYVYSHSTPAPCPDNTYVYTEAEEAAVLAAKVLPAPASTNCPPALGETSIDVAAGMSPPRLMDFGIAAASATIALQMKKSSSPDEETSDVLSGQSVGRPPAVGVCPSENCPNPDDPPSDFGESHGKDDGAVLPMAAASKGDREYDA